MEGAVKMVSFLMQLSFNIFLAKRHFDAGPVREGVNRCLIVPKVVMQLFSCRSGGEIRLSVGVTAQDLRAQLAESGPRAGESIRIPLAIGRLLQSLWNAGKPFCALRFVLASSRGTIHNPVISIFIHE
jgi:hypothetical protein